LVWSVRTGQDAQSGPNIVQMHECCCVMLFNIISPSAGGESQSLGAPCRVRRKSQTQNRLSERARKGKRKLEPPSPYRPYLPRTTLNETARQMEKISGAGWERRLRSLNRYLKLAIAHGRVRRRAVNGNMVQRRVYTFQVFFGDTLTSTLNCVMTPIERT